VKFGLGTLGTLIDRTKDTAGVDILRGAETRRGLTKFSLGMLGKLIDRTKDAAGIETRRSAKTRRGLMNVGFGILGKRIDRMTDKTARPAPAIRNGANTGFVSCDALAGTSAGASSGHDLPLSTAPPCTVRCW